MVDQILLRSVAEKLEAIRIAAQHESPTTDFETMLAEIGRGYCSAQPSRFGAAFDGFLAIMRLK